MVADLLEKDYNGELDGYWVRERTATPVRAFAVRLHATSCSLRETASILIELGVERSHGAVWNWVHRIADSVPDPPTAKSSRVGIDQTAIKINGEWSWLYAAIVIETKFILDGQLFGWHGTNPAAAFLRGLCEKHDFSVVWKNCQETPGRNPDRTSNNVSVKSL